MSVYRNIHCKLKPIHLWAIVKENPGLRKYFNRFIALLSMKRFPNCVLTVKKRKTILTCTLCSIVHYL